MAQYSKVLLTLTFEGDGQSFTKAMLDELGAVVARGDVVSAVLDAPLDRGETRRGRSDRERGVVPGHGRAVRADRRR